MRKKPTEKYTCKDCSLNYLCSERRGICTSFRRKIKSEIVEKLIMATCFIAMCVFFACMLYVASEGTLKAFLIGITGMLPSGFAVIYITNNMVHYDVEE